MKILLLILLTLPCLIYSQPDQFKKSSYIDHVIMEKNPEIYRNARVKTQTGWGQNGNNKSRREKIMVKTFDRNGNLIKAVGFRNNDEKVIMSNCFYNNSGYITKISEKHYLNDTLENYSIQNYTYDSLSRMTYKSEFRKSKLTDYWVYEYNDIENSIRKTHIDGFSKRSKSQTFYFNNDNYITRHITNYITWNDYIYYNDSLQIIAYNNDTIIKTTTSHFDSQKNIIKSVYSYEGKDNGYNIIEYNPKGLSTSSFFKDLIGNGSSKLERQYDNNGNIIGENHYEDDALIFRKIYSYNSDGLLIEEAYGNKDIDFSKGKIVYTYEYY